MRTVIFRSIAPYLTSLMVLFSIFVLLRGHNEPGGGFIGGLIAASALAIYGIACGVAPVRRRYPLSIPWRISAFGLFIGTLAGVLSVFAGVPFMTGLWVYPSVFGVELALSSTCSCSTSVSIWSWSEPSRRSRWRSRKGTGTDGASFRASRRRPLYRFDLPVHVQAHHPGADGRGDPEQCRQPADFHRRTGHTGSAADYRRRIRCSARRRRQSVAAGSGSHRDRHRVLVLRLLVGAGLSRVPEAWTPTTATRCAWPSRWMSRLRRWVTEETSADGWKNCRPRRSLGRLCDGAGLAAADWLIAATGCASASWSARSC
jgi:multicomponent Na+:H+ antiporter subunit B